MVLKIDSMSFYAQFYSAMSIHLMARSGALILDLKEAGVYCLNTQIISIPELYLCQFPFCIVFLHYTIIVPLFHCSIDFSTFILS